MFDEIHHQRLSFFYTTMFAKLFLIIQLCYDNMVINNIFSHHRDLWFFTECVPVMSFLTSSPPRYLCQPFSRIRSPKRFKNFSKFPLGLLLEKNWKKIKLLLLLKIGRKGFIVDCSRTVMYHHFSINKLLFTCF